MRSAPGVDIVTRLYDLSDLPHLDRLAFSVMGQSGVAPLRLHVMLQRFSFTEVQRVREAVSDLCRLHEGASVICHNWDYPVPFDLRVPLLNWGLDVAVGRYVMCADIYDQLCPAACMALLDRLSSTKAALAVGGITVQPVQWWGDVVLPGPAPDPPSQGAVVAMIDRGRVAAKDCVFRAGDAGSETTAFVERLAGRYDVDAACQSRELVVRTHPL